MNWRGACECAHVVEGCLTLDEALRAISTHLETRHAALTPSTRFQSYEPEPIEEVRS